METEQAMADMLQEISNSHTHTHLKWATRRAARLLLDLQLGEETAEYQRVVEALCTQAKTIPSAANDNYSQSG